MSLKDQYDTVNDEEEEVDDVELSGNENGDGFDEDMEALKKACLRTGTDLNGLDIVSADDERPSTSTAASPASADSGSEDDLEIFRSIRNRLALSVDVYEPVSLKPLCTLPPISSDEDAEDDFETLRVIQKRFLAYPTDYTSKNSREDDMEKTEPIYMTRIPLKDATGNDICENFQDYEQTGNISHVSSDNAEMQPVSLVQCDQSDVNVLSTYKSSRFPKSAQLLFDAIKKNRSYQTFLRSKLAHIEVKIEENKKLKERVKILRDFQVSCKKLTGRALSAKKDPRIQLISARKFRTFEDPEVNDKRVTADYGPQENSRVASYKMALIDFPLKLERKNWSREERENLEKGIRQQFQERALQVSVGWLSTSDGSPQDGSNLDGIIATVKDLEITPERIREFLPKVDWDQLASYYVKGRCGAECETRWLNHEDPLINRNPWTAEEDKNLLLIVQEMGIDNWFDIAVSLGSNRTPFQCLSRYQRSLNPCILKREWTEEEDDQLRIAVEVFGESDWQSVASTLKGRTGTQCSNRWKKSLHPTRRRVGRWTRDEDKRLKVAVLLFGPKNWRKIAEVVPGRTQVQCRERWVNSLDPALNVGIWTEEEDSRLEAAIEENGYCWSKVATCVSSRTDNQCWRRWKTLHPEEVPLLQEARKIRKAALISNFVDRESERPALGPNDFNIQLPMITATSEPSKEKGKQRRKRPESEKENAAALRLSPEKRSRKSCRKGAQVCSVEVPQIINENEAGTATGHDSVRMNGRNPPSENNNCTEPAQDVTFQKKRGGAWACSVEVPLVINEIEADTATVRNPHLENSNCTEPAEDVTFKKKRKREPPSGNNNHTEPAQYVAIQKKRKQPPSGHVNCSDRMQDGAIQTYKRKQQSESSKFVESVQDNCSSHLLSALCMTSNHEAESFGSSLSVKRRKNHQASPKQLSKRSMCTESHEEQYSICSEISVFSGGDDGAEVMQNSGVESEPFGADDASRKAKPRSKRKTCMNSLTSQISRTIVAEHFKNLSATKNTKKNGTKQQQSKSRKSNMPSGDEDGQTDGDHQTLACFLRNKLNKRKCEIVDNACLSEGKDERSKIDQTQCGLQHCDGENGTNIEIIDVVNETIALHDIMREPSKIDKEDITLACLRKRLKKRRVTIAQSSNHGDMFE